MKTCLMVSLIGRSLSLLEKLSITRTPSLSPEEACLSAYIYEIFLPLASWVEVMCKFGHQVFSRRLIISIYRCRISPLSSFECLLTDCDLHFDVNLHTRMTLSPKRQHDALRLATYSYISAHRSIFRLFQRDMGQCIPP